MTARAGPDGVLHRTVPVGAADGEFEVAVVVQAKSSVNGAGRTPTPEELGWPPGYFENVVGSIDDDTFMRHPQGEFEQRDPLE
jgi:hypothetical protein